MSLHLLTLQITKSLLTTVHFSRTRCSIPAVGGVRVGSWSTCLSQVHHCSNFTFRVVQTVGVNAAKTTDTIKFPRFTFGCIPRRQEERKEGRTEEERAKDRRREEKDRRREEKEVQSGGMRRHVRERTEKKKQKREERDRCKKTAALREEWSIREGAWLDIEVGGANAQNEGMKVSLQHNKRDQTTRQQKVLQPSSLFLYLNTNLTFFKSISIHNI